jgi:hypothetical protein
MKKVLCLLLAALLLLGSCTHKSVTGKVTAKIRSGNLCLVSVATDDGGDRGLSIPCHDYDVALVGYRYEFKWTCPVGCSTSDSTCEWGVYRLLEDK